MPIYAYRCESCGYAQDVLQKISDPLLTVCPTCGAASFTKQITAAGFQLKGTGWYATDFKGGGAKPASNANAPEGSKPAAGDAAAAGSPAPAESPAPASPASVAPASSSGSGTGSKQ